MDVAAPPQAVWAVLTDCAGAPRVMPKLISCTVLEKGGMTVTTRWVTWFSNRQ